MRPTQPERGYSLIELLVVVAIILLIASIAIPNYFRSKMSANEAAAVNNLRGMTTTLTIYALTFKECGYPNTLDNLKPGTPPTKTAASLLEAGMAQDAFYRSGYNYSYRLIGGVGDCVGTPGNDFEAEAQPAIHGRTGTHGFFVNTTLVIRRDPDGDADSSSPPV